MIMKKFLLMSTLCALALVGCKDDSEPEIPTDIDYSGLVLNEICGNDGNASEEDWIEIIILPIQQLISMALNW